jgi:hypothetical protein
MRNPFQLSPFQLMQWIARLTGFIPSFFFVLFIFAEGLPDLLDGYLAVIPILAMLSFTIAGYVIALFQFRIGGLMMMLGGLIMGFYLLLKGGEGLGLIVVSYSLPFIIPGYLFFSLKRFRK